MFVGSLIQQSPNLITKFLRPIIISHQIRPLKKEKKTKDSFILPTVLIICESIKIEMINVGNKNYFPFKILPLRQQFHLTTSLPAALTSIQVTSIGKSELYNRLATKVQARGFCMAATIFFCQCSINTTWGGGRMG